MVFRRNNSAVNVDRVESKNAFDAAGVVDEVDVAFADTILRIEIPDCVSVRHPF
jgi:hypothetical protein